MFNGLTPRTILIIDDTQRVSGQEASKLDLGSILTELFDLRTGFNSESSHLLFSAIRYHIAKKHFWACDDILRNTELSFDECRRRYFQVAHQLIYEASVECQDLARSYALSCPDRRSDQLVSEICELAQLEAGNFRGAAERKFNTYFVKETPLDLPTIKDNQSASSNKIGGVDSASQAVDGKESNDNDVGEETPHRTDECDVNDYVRRLEHIWNHLTISRDQTSAADAAQELLFIFRVSRLELSSSLSDRAEHPSRKIKNLPIKRFRSRNNGRYRSNIENRFQIHPNFGLSQVEPSIVSENIKIPKMSKEENMSGVAQESNTELDYSSNPNMNQTRTLVTDGSYHDLRQRIALLEDENRILKDSSSGSQKWQLLHFIQFDPKRPAAAYVDEPSWTINPKLGPILTAYLPITDVGSFLNKKEDVAFIVTRYYSPNDQWQEVSDASRSKKPLPSPRWFKESISLRSKEMLDAARKTFEKIPQFHVDFPKFDLQAHIQAPYLFWYHYRSQKDSKLRSLSPEQRQLLELLIEWIEKHYEKLYDLAESQMDRGVISQETMPFLIRPRDVMVWEDGGKIETAISKSWASQHEPTNMRRKPQEGEWKDEITHQAVKHELEWKIDAWRYEYDGRLLKNPKDMMVEFSAKWLDEEVQIRSLSVFPLRFAPDSLKMTLQNRGETFWKCRHHNIVSYEDISGIHGSGERFVVDFQTYKQLHSDSIHFNKVYSKLHNDDCELMSSEMMESNDPPPSPDIYVLPSTIPGYDLRSKKWVDLDVDHIRDVIWNKKSFDHLVVDFETKELVQALVMHQIAKEKSTDIIDRKGNGLIMLLHGAPGTGKTFTAESVAEIAEKPLFRVTCGDISTDPEKAEKYLNSVLHLGKTWGCVVLIDEAEVFLEQRSLDNLERNALVSVFLRVLEYYEGILILTSNRVGTFDEAFKSRILLSLHYDKLTQGQRMRIWKNFLRRLKEMETDEDGRSGADTTKSCTQKTSSQEEVTDIDFDDIECYLTELSQYDLNGRQIRNAITSARQLAMFRKQAMSYQHLKHVITVSSKFDSYLKKVQEGQTADQIARIDGIR